MDVFLLQHVREHPDREEDVKLIGIYSSEAAAQAAIERLLPMPGFRDFPDGFHIDRCPVDQDHWEEGFIT